jgi:hypothetical protein
MDIGERGNNLLMVEGRSSSADFESRHLVAKHLTVKFSLVTGKFKMFFFLPKLIYLGLMGAINPTKKKEITIIIFIAQKVGVEVTQETG